MAFFQTIDLGDIHVHAQHMIADFGQTGPGDQANVAGTKQGDFHGISTRKLANRRNQQACLLKMTTADRLPCRPQTVSDGGELQAAY
jgi:hypothetical protein